MSEYWKSTPKYWCKHCNAFVKDTPFERKQHESTAKHQGNLKRFLRGIQNDHERSEREKDKVKAEVERLNKVVGSSSSVVPPTTKHLTVKKSVTGPLSAVDQKKQWAQLAEMGIQVPEGFRAEVAAPGEWQKIAERPVEDLIKDGPVSTGVRKRKYEGQEEEEEAGEIVARRGWGTTTRRYPGEEQLDLDALLSEPIHKKEKMSTGKTKLEKIDKEGGQTRELGSTTKIKQNTKEETSENKQMLPDIRQDVPEGSDIKDEPSENNRPSLLSITSETADVPVFKKRKAKGK